MKTIHKLIIISLHDGQAKCSCDGWQYSITAKVTPEHLKERHNKHKQCAK